MNDMTELDGNKSQLDKAKLNLVYVGIGSVIMLFAGLTSAYIVSMGDSFWLKTPLPNAFIVSTVIIILSSITFQMAVSYSKKNANSLLKIMMVATFVLGLAFVYFQFKGYGQLVDKGVYVSSNHILVSNGRYGDYFEVKYKGDFVEVDGNKFLLKGKQMDDASLKELQNFMTQYDEVDSKETFEISANPDFQLYYQNKLLEEHGAELEFVDRVRLRDLAWNIRDKRGDFFVKGEVGKDFHIYYKGKELEYEDRELKLNGKVLSNYLQIKANESADSASSYLYIITFMHLLHIIVTLLVLIKLVIRSLSGSITSEDNVSLKMGAVFWHFLGFLWVFLLLFLLFIH